tara:strand:- start:45 stop:986 length:942 start_codon:yes stop_codon:yes gene_type:complete
MDTLKLKKAGIVHKLVRNKILYEIKPGMRLYDIRRNIEDWINQYSRSQEKSYDYQTSAIGFPIGLSLNNVAAHFSPFSYDKEIYTENDILKIDYGVHYGGVLVDAAFSIAENSQLKKLKAISEEATNTAIKNAGIDVVLGDLGKDIEEIITSYELIINGREYPVVACRDLCGHQILPFRIHGSKVIPNIKVNYNQRMKHGEIYAVETFPTTGTGILKNGKNNSHLMINYASKQNLNKYKKMETYQRIMEKRNTLPWHLDWLCGDFKIDLNELQILIDNKVVTEYPPLIDIKGSYVAQTEHTIGVFNNKVEQYT